MQNLIDTARYNMRKTQDLATSHRQFVTMFTSAGMLKFADYHQRKAEFNDNHAMLYQEILFSLLADS